MPSSLTASLAAQRRLGEAGRGVTQSYQRLSSGLRINRASDDAAGLAIAENLNVDSRVYAQGARNISDGISALSIADGALVELSQIVIRQRELAEQSANGVYSTPQRQALQSEADALANEYNRITQTVVFNNQNLLDGSVQNLSIQFGYGANNNISANMVSELDNAQFSGSFNSFVSFAGAATDNDYVDVNGDGKADILSVNNSNSLGVRLSNGDGTFTAQVTYTNTAGANNDVLTYGDLNGDGIVDVVTGSGDRVNVRFGNGDGSFRASTSYDTLVSSGGGSMAISLADINGDGKLDILTSDTKEAGSFTALINTGTGAFSAGVLTSGLASDIAAFVTGDFNNDGRTDFVSDTNILFLANSNGTFAQRSVSVLGGASAINTIAGDFNQDGKQDLAFTSGSSIKITLGNGDGTFGAATTAVSGITSPRPTQFADVNGDGYKDLVGFRTAGGASAYVALGNGTGTFSAATSYTFGSGVGNNTLVFADISGDGVLDMANHNNGVSNYEMSIAQTTQVTTMKHFSIMSQAESREALTYLSGLNTQISSERGAIGATLSRLESAHQAVTTQKLNSDEARSQITDVDVAQETANLVRFQILEKASAALLAQINTASMIDLTLLKDK